MKQRKAMIESDTPLSVRRQCQLLEVNRNRLVPPPRKLSDDDATICRRDQFWEPTGVKDLNNQDFLTKYSQNSSDWNPTVSLLVFRWRPR